MGADLEQVNRKQRYKEICDDYLREFCALYDFPYDDDAWVGGDAGTIACVADYFFDFDSVIRYAVDNHLTDIQELLQWYDYTLFAQDFDLCTPNFQSWHKGCPRLTWQEQEQFRTYKKALDDLTKEYKTNPF